MSGWSRSRYHQTDLAVVGIVAVLVIVLALLSSGGSAQDGPPYVVTLPSAASFDQGTVVPAGFLGLSLEYGAVEGYAGTNPSAIDPVFEQLIRNITPGQQPVLRIGGDSTDTTWWPGAGITRAPGINYTLTPTWLGVTRALTQSLKARLILGVNLEAGDPQLSDAEAHALLSGLGTGSVRALELGNEPELYGAFPWYRTADGRRVTGRPRGYNFAAFTQDFTNYGATLPTSPLAGPAVNGSKWMSSLDQFVKAVPHLGLVTIHRYPLQNCFTTPASTRYPSLHDLLSDTASAGMADALTPYATIAHQHGLPIRIDEINSVSCGASRRVSQSFASALWAADALFELVHAGFDGVNIHTFPNAGYELFKLAQAGGRWRGTVSPEYYGLLLFAQAAQPGARLVRVGASDATVKVWATRATDARLRIVLINKDVSHSRLVKLRAPHASATGTLERLRAPSAAARSGVTLGDKSFGSSTETGVLPTPQTTTLQPNAGAYEIELPPASAALLTLAPGHG